MNGAGPGPFRWFWADVARQPCPDRGEPAATGSGRSDTPGQPTRRTACRAAAISNEVWFAAALRGYLARETPRPEPELFT